MSNTNGNSDSTNHMHGLEDSTDIPITLLPRYTPSPSNVAAHGGAQSTAQQTASQQQHTTTSAIPRPANDPGLIHQLAETIANSHCFARDAGDELYIYRNGVYKPDASGHLRREVKRLLKAWDRSKRWHENLANQVEAYIAADARTLWEQPPQTIANVANGLLDVTTRTLYPHSPAHLSTIQLPVQYDPQADCPIWDWFLTCVLPADVYSAGIVWQLIRLLMVPHTDAHQAVLLSGPGGNGKGALLAAIRALLGAYNVSNFNLDQLTSQRFLAAKLYGKLANICDDLSTKQLADTSLFKRIVAGDQIEADRKYAAPLTFKPFVRLLFSANEYPPSSDSSPGFYDRWVVIPFEEAFRGQQNEIPRSILDAHLANPTELSGVLNRALDARLKMPKYRLQVTSSMQQAWGNFRSTTDWVITWLERVLVAHPTGKIEKKTIHQALIWEAQRVGRGVMTASALYAKIRQHWPGINDAQLRLVPGQNAVECFIGLDWHPKFAP